MKLDHVSPSTLGQAAKCGEQLRFRLQEGPEPPGFALIRGRAVAESIERNMTAKLNGGDPRPLEELGQIAHDAVLRELEVGSVRLDLAEDGEVLTFAEARGRTIDDAVTLAALHAHAAAPNILPTAVEARVELSSSRLPVKLVGVLDLIAEDRNGGETIRDAKANGKRPDASSADDSDQLTAYDALYRGLRGKAPSGLILDHLVLPTKTLGPRYFEHQAPARTPADFDALAGRIERVVRAVDAEVWIPAPEGAWWCSEKFCGYWSRCVFARGRKRATS